MFPPFLISWLVLYLEGDPTITRRDAIMYTAAMLICALFYSIPYTVYRYLTCMVAMRTRSACSALIFDKVNRHVFSCEYDVFKDTTVE